LANRPIDSQSVLLSVTASPTCDVWIKHPEMGPEAQLTHLGQTPLHEEAGAHLGDVVILESKSQGIHYEEEIKYGTPGQIKEINKKFESGSFEPNIVPRNVPGLAFYRGDAEVGRYAPGMPITMVEGTYNLELRGLKLKAPVPVKVTVVAGRSTKGELINLKDKLQ
jgi:hypothetical protein